MVAIKDRNCLFTFPAAYAPLPMVALSGSSTINGIAITTLGQVLGEGMKDVEEEVMKVGEARKTRRGQRR
jgi:hypothetical protein